MAVRLELTPVEVRVLGCLVEKQRTTPDAYPLTLNSLRLACNQTTNRDPVMDLDEGVVRTAAQSLGARGLARFASGHSGRVAKYRHLLREALGVSPGEVALLGVLMLRGAQTPAELRARSERLHSFDEPGAFEASLDRLAEAGLVERLERRPGQKEGRVRHLLAAGEDVPGEPEASIAVAEAPPDADAARLERLESEVAELRADVAALRRDLGA